MSGKKFVTLPVAFLSCAVFAFMFGGLILSCRDFKSLLLCFIESTYPFNISKELG